MSNRETSYPTWASGKQTTLPSWSGKTSTPKLSASPGLGPHHAPPKVKPAAKPKVAPYVPSPMVRVNVKPPTVTTAQKVYHATSTKPFFLGQKPDHFASLGRLGLIPIYVYGHGKPGPTGDDKTQLNSNQLAFAAHEKYISEGGLPGALLRDTATSLVPKTFVDLAQGNHVTGSRVVSDIANAALNFAPAGKAAGILGGLKGLKALKGATEAARLAPDEVKALQIVKEGVPIEKRLAEARGKDLKDLKAAAKHVHDVNGVPRIVPSNHKLIEAYQTQAASEAAGNKIRESIPGAKIVRGKQNALYSEQRGKNVAAGAEALNSKYGMAGFHAALAEHKGPLPTIKFAGFGDLTPENLDAAAEQIKGSHLLHYQQIRAAQSLERAVHDGVVPTPSDLALLEHVFGKDVNGTLKSPEHLAAMAKVTELLNIPRTIMSSFDLSAPFRQGLVMAARHPIISAKNFGPMVKAFGSEQAYKRGMQEIVSRQNFPLYQAMKLNLTDFEHGLPGMEEAFIGKNYAEKIPVIGHPVRGSGRAYTLYLNKTRADVADQLLRYAKSAGIDIERHVEPLHVLGKQVAMRPKNFLESLGQYINAGTGRGTYGSKNVEQALPFLNSLMFSPRLLASRFNFLNPIWYARLDPFVRKQALRAAFQTLGAGMTVLTLAHEAGAKVGLDPTNADFGKIRIGNTRIDIWGGFQQPVRLLAQVYAGKVTSSTSGKTLHLGPEGPGHLSRFDIGLRFAESKLGPVPGAVLDVSKGQNQIGQPLDWSLRHGDHFNWNSPYAQRLIPLLVQDAHDLSSDKHGGLNGIEAALAGYGVGAFGVGLQTYGPKKSGSGNAKDILNMPGVSDQARKQISQFFSTP